MTDLVVWLTYFLWESKERVVGSKMVCSDLDHVGELTDGLTKRVAFFAIL